MRYKDFLNSMEQATRGIVQQALDGALMKSIYEQMRRELLVAMREHAEEQLAEIMKEVQDGR